MLHIIKGLSGYGKTHYVWNSIYGNKCENKKIIVLVPEQFSFESEKIFCEIQNNKKLTNVEVLSFNRLSNLIFREYGGFTKKVLNDVKSSIIMNMVLCDIKNELKVYGEQINNKAFCKNLINIIKTLKNNNIFSKDIFDYSGKIESELLADKLFDINLIYKNYQNQVNKLYTDTNDLINKACDKLKGRTFFLGYTVYIDGFRAFTESEYNMLNYVISQSDDVYITLCLDEDQKKNIDILNCVRKTESKLLRIADISNVALTEAVFLKNPYRFKNKELRALEQNTYNILSGESIQNNIDWSDQNNFHIVECGTPYQEVEFVASQILNLIKNSNYKFSDVFIITRDLDLYKYHIENVFEMYDIPYFLDEKKSIRDKNFIVFVMASLKAVKSFSTLQILKVLKTGFLEVDADDISKLEIYCNIWSVNKKDWFEEFTLNPKGFSEIFTEDDKRLLDEINIVREKVVLVLEELKNSLNKEDYGKNYVKAIYTYLIKNNIPQTLRDASDDSIGLDENVNLWDSFINILDDITDIVGDSLISLNKFIDLMNCAIFNTDFGLVPQTIDQVIIGQVDRVIPYNPKIVFVVGLNQSVFPLIKTGVSIFSNAENKKLCKCGFDFLADKVEMSIEERYYIYMSMSSASNKVYLSYHQKSVDGRPMCRSIIISYIEKFFDGLQIKKFDEKDLSLIHNNKTAYGYICKNFNLEDVTLKSVKKYLASKEGFKEKIAKLNVINEKTDFYVKNKNLFKSYIGNSLKLSPSSIERFHTCKFKFFCNDILKIKSNKKADLNKIVQGTVIHYILKEVMEREKRGISNNKIKEILKGYIQNIAGEKYIKSNGYIYISNELCKLTENIVEYIHNEQSISEFKAEFFEVEISENSNFCKPLKLKLESGEEITIYGKIDRVDSCQIGNNKYIRVIDYKSGSKEFCLDDVYYGLNMQMLIYLFVLTNFSTKTQLKPAGVLYMPVKDKINFVDRNCNDDNIEKLSKNRFKMSGILLDDVEILSKMEKNLEGKIIPAKLNKDGTLAKVSATLDEYSFRCLGNYIKDIIVNMCNTIFKGDINAYPVYSSRYKNVCTYCDYKQICNLGDNFKILKSPNDSWIFGK